VLKIRTDGILSDLMHTTGNESVAGGGAPDATN
jgi:hypothetical protein